MAQKWYTIYNIDRAVGSGATNELTDVMLIQFMLNRIAPLVQSPVPKPASAIAVDGRFSSALRDWILWFQKSNNALSKVAVTADGRIDPLPYFNNGGPPPYTIYALNNTYRRRFKASHDRFDSDPTVPAPLRVKFTQDDL
jgi:hypothetical protein